MAAEIIELGAHPRMTVEEALSLTARESPKEVVILFFDGADDFGMRTSNMSRKDALWLVELARDEILNGGVDD